MKKRLKVRRKDHIKPMSVIMIMTKESILYRIKEKLKTYSKKRLAVFYYNLLKNDLPQLKTIKRKALPKPKKKKEKLTKAEKKRRQKKLSALNKWRVSQGMKKIVIK